MSESTTNAKNFTEGRIFGPLIRFALPVAGASFLQAMYGGIDLLIVGQFASTSDVSGVSTGSQLMHTLTMVIIGLSLGITVLAGQRLGEKRNDEAGKVIGSGISLFAVIGVLWSLTMLVFADFFAKFMNAPKEAFFQTRDYIRICGGGALFVTAYNVLGSIFRGIGNSKMPLITVMISAFLNVIGDYIFVAVFHQGAAGAAWATIISQGTSVIISLFIIRKIKLPFKFDKSYLKLKKDLALRIFKLGCPVALQDFLVGLSFIALMIIVNDLGLNQSAAVGVAGKVCAFLMLVPSAFSQSMSSFVAQNYGAKKMDRARKALFYGISLSLGCGIFLCYAGFFHGNILAAAFSKDADVIIQSHSYLKAYAIDCIFTSFLFCMIGYFNGTGKTLFVMIQGLIGAFGIRIPVAYLVSRLVKDPSLFQIGLATPCSSLVQICICSTMFFIQRKKDKLQQKKEEPPLHLIAKTFYSAECSILENYYPLAAKIYNEMLGVYDNERSYITYYFDGALPIGVVLWLDDWRSSLSDEDRLELFTLLDVPVTKSAYVAALEVNIFLTKKGYGKAIMQDFIKDKDFVALSAIDGSEGFYRKCGFNVDASTNYFFYKKEGSK